MNNIYLISSPYVNDTEIFDSAIVSAKSEGEARLIHPNGYKILGDKWVGTNTDGSQYATYGHTEWATWVKPKDIGLIAVKLIGTTEMPTGVILASFTPD